MAGINSKAAGKGLDCGCGNKKGYNGNEIQAKEFSDGSGLDVYDFNARTYDQQIGRFIQIDPLTEEAGQDALTPYHFSGNNPSTFNDPDGKCPWCVGAIIGGVGGFAYGAVKYGFKNGGWKKVLATTLGGAVAGGTLGLATGLLGSAGGASTLGGANVAMASGGAAIFGAAAGNLTEQGTSIALGAQDNFDSKDLTYSMVLALPEALLSKAIFDPVGNAIKSELSGAITEGAISTLSGRERGKIVKDVAKQLKGVYGSEISRKNAKIAAAKIVNHMEESQSDIMRFSIKVTENGVSVGTTIVENKVSDKIKDELNQ
jgi:RHS repeat-associated protein